MNHYTYILTPYEPIRDIKDNDLTSYQILLECSKYEYPELTLLNQKIIDKIGFNNTVYGIQKNIDNDELFVEYYFYNHNDIWKNDHNLAWNTIQECLDSEVDESIKVDIPFDSHLGMFSIDIPKNNNKITDLDIYVMNPAKGFCLRWNQNGIFKKNNYSFFYNPNEVQDEFNKRKIPMACLLFGNYQIWNESVCLALKREEFLSIYYCQVKIDTLILFLRRLNYPKHVINYFEENKSHLDHMLFDFGYDFDLVPGGMMKIIRGGFYGYF